MTTKRRIVCEAAFGFGPFDTISAGNWVQLTDSYGSRLKAADWGFGRDSEFEHFPPGTATVVLRNRDRALDPDNPASPYAGDLLPNVPIRLRSQNVATGTYEDEFYGFVQNGWQQELAPKGIGDCRLELVDLLGVMGGYKLPDVFEHAVLAQNPVGFWILDAAGSEQVVDLGSGRVDGMVDGEGVALGDRVIVPGHQPAARFDSTNGSVFMGRSPIVATDATSLQNALVMVTFLVNNTPTSHNLSVLFMQGNGALGGGFLSGTGFAALLHNTGIAIYGVQGILAGDSARSVTDGSPHLLFGANETIGIDTATLTSAAVTSVDLPGLNGVGIGGGPGLTDADFFDGWIGAVALFANATTVGVSGRQAILNGYSKLNGQRSDQHLTWALDLFNVPAGLRNLDQGTVIMGPANTKDRDVLEWMREVTATEGGGLYIDHRDGGKIRFTARYARFLNSRSTTSQATFSDAPGAAAVVRYPAEGLDLAPNGLDGIVNQVTATWAGGEVTVQDDTSIFTNKYGPRTRQIDTVATTVVQARSAAEWMVARYKDPRSRIRGCVTSAKSTQARDDKVQVLKIDDRITFRVQPLHIGTTTEVALFVDGVSHSAQGVEWQTAFRFAPVDSFAPWIWGTGAWGQTTTWG